MRSRSLLLVLVLLICLLLLMRPWQVWAEFKRIHSQWDLLLRLVVAVIFIYLLYGLYTIGAGNVSWWPFAQIP